MDYLPVEICYEIFKYLRLKSILRLRLVSKTMNERVKNYKVTEVVFNQKNLFYDFKLNDNWTFTNVPINRKNIIDCLNSSFEQFPSFNYENLKRLRIANLSGNAKISVNFLNKLIKLEQLEVHYNKLNVDDKLNLPNLKILAFKSSVQIIMEIGTTSLKKLSLDYDTFEFVKFENPDNISHLSINNHDKNILKFKNLEYYEFNTANNLDKNIIGMLPRLNRIQINFHCFNDTKMLKNILEQKASLGRESLQISYKGLMITNDQQLNFRSQHRFLFQMSAYSILIDNLQCESKIIYNELIHLAFEIPQDFLTKFNNIQMVEINSKIDDAKQLIEFIKGCKTLNELFIFDSGLNQSFYDSLSKISFLVILRIFERRNLNLNFEFVSKMDEYLEQLITDQPVEMKHLKCFKNLKEFCFKVDDNKTNFVRLNNKYQIKCSNLEVAQKMDKLFNDN